MNRRTDRIRTTSFRVAREHFGSVYVYRPSARFSLAWASATRTMQFPPYASLATALRVLTGDFVALQKSADEKRAFIISRMAIKPTKLEMAIAAWETAALKNERAPLAELAAAGELAEEKLDVADLVERRKRRCPILTERWAWDVATWNIAHLVAGEPLKTDAHPLRLRIATNGELLSWGDPLTVDGRRPAAAMHRITPRLITVQGISEPVVAFESSHVRFPLKWTEARRPKNAWLDLGSELLLHVPMDRRPLGQDRFTTIWRDFTPDVLKAASPIQFPDGNAELSLENPMRVSYRYQPSSHPLGAGVGTCFHECVARHVHERLNSASPVMFDRDRTRRWPTRQKITPRAGLHAIAPRDVERFKFLVVYAHSEIRKRALDGIIHVLKTKPHVNDTADLKDFEEQLKAANDDTWTTVGPIDVQFISPKGAQQFLLTRNREQDIKAWVESSLPALRSEKRTQAAALVETDADAALGDDNGKVDPKHVIRRLLAKRGVVTQFIDIASAAPPPRKTKDEDEETFREHAAAYATYDLMRSAGCLLRPFPSLAGPDQALFVGIHVAYLRNRKGFVANLVAARAGSHDAYAFVEKTGWAPLGQATATFLATNQVRSREDVTVLVERAVEQLRVKFRKDAVALLFDVVGCRRLWNCLADSAEGELDPWMTAEAKAVVRIRADATEVPRPAGVGPWLKRWSPAKYTDFRPMLLHEPDGESPLFVVGGSAVMNKERGARNNTRLTASPAARRKPWHALTATEIQVLESGPWMTSDLRAQVAMLCRAAPTWERVLRWPSPLHFARAVVDDHPDRYDDVDDADGNG